MFGLPWWLRLVRKLPAMQEIWVQSLGWENPLEKGMAAHCNILASFVKDNVSICAWIYLWAFYFVPLIYISVFVPVPYCLDNCGFVMCSSPKKTYRWLTNTWKDAQHHSLSEKCKSKPQWGTISCQSEWLPSKSLQAINAGEGVEKREPSYTVGGNAN